MDLLNVINFSWLQNVAVSYVILEEEIALNVPIGELYEPIWLDVELKLTVDEVSGDAVINSSIIVNIIGVQQMGFLSICGL